MAVYKDFDKYIKERQKERGISFTVFGDTYFLPPTLPFEVVLFMQTLQGRDKDEKVDSTFVYDLFEKTIGSEQFRQIRAHPEFDTDLMLELIKYIFSAYGLSNVDDTAPKAEAES